MAPVKSDCLEIEAISSCFYSTDPQIIVIIIIDFNPQVEVSRPPQRRKLICSNFNSLIRYKLEMNHETAFNP